MYYENTWLSREPKSASVRVKSTWDNWQSLEPVLLKHCDAATGQNTLKPGQNGWHLADISYVFYWIKIITFWHNFQSSLFFNVQYIINTLRPKQDGRLFPDDIFKSIFINENVQILIKISLTFVPKTPINNILVLVQIMDWHRPGDKPLSEPMMVSLLTHICVTWPQWVNTSALLVQTNDDPLYWGIYLSLGLNELIHCGLVMPYGDID